MIIRIIMRTTKLTINLSLDLCQGNTDTILLQQKMGTYFFLSIVGISLLSAFSTITYIKHRSKDQYK